MPTADSILRPIHPSAHGRHKPRDLALPQSIPSNETVPLIDPDGRPIDRLRLSVTSACNLNCLYCRPSARNQHGNKSLTDSQRLDFILHLFRHRRLSQLRLTGGEPLLHPSIVSLIAAIRGAAPGLSLAMTTNACRLAALAADLRVAGLDRLNISLDAINPRKYRDLTGGRLQDVLDGIDAARAVGFPPPRLNSVVIAGHNDDELPELAEWAIRKGLEIRFLEAMPIGPAAEFNRTHFVPARRIRSLLETRFHLTPLPRADGETASRFIADSQNLRGTLGIIAPISESFCGQCRRMRLTADGLLFPCLLDSRCANISPCWQSGTFSPSAADSILQHAISQKRPTGPLLQSTPMISLGG